MNITLEGIREILADRDTVFMRQGRGAAIHLSVGNCRANNLLCGVTYSRSGSRSSYIRPLSLSQADTSEICKKCLKIVQERLHLSRKRDKVMKEDHRNYWICPYCGLQYDRRNEWEMYQVDAHIDRHDRGELE